ncbi:peptidoglycan DD-metalloendopeptidase family protein [Paraburkholderia sp. GAS448]|uniref:peptidoglycan DD-metalloendopeptidase family protein n=1 Tax=Paraburkholderia sp. GAS448 TaxID=3035136 RepID=UPI003D1E76DF
MKKTVVLGACAIALVMLAACSGFDPDRESALNRAAGIEISQTDSGVQVRLPDSILFDFDHAVLRANAGPAIDRLAVLVRRSDRPVNVEGHTDNAGTHEYNQTLSEARAKTVAVALEQHGIAASRITTRGFAFDRPVASNDTEAGRARNRRTEIVIVGESVDGVLGRPTPQAGGDRQSREARPAGTAGQEATPSPGFIWPVHGHVAEPFADGQRMMIAGMAGAPVKAVALGRVVYAGTGIAGYGPLVILKHNDRFVTAYAHMGRLLVKDNQAVVQGQTIAEMGVDANGEGTLQFEVRRNGRQLDPLVYLPKL